MGAVKRTPVKINKTVRSEWQIAFESMLPPQQQVDLKKVGIDPSKISDAQIKALAQSNFALWSATSGIKVDHKPFDFKNHRYILPLYLDRAKEVVLMKSSQMGATIYLLLYLLFFLKNNPAKGCLFFPTQDGVTLLSKDRMTPLINSNAELKELVKSSDTLGYKQVGESSSLYLRHLGGIASKDSTPFDILCFDEVRLLPAGEIDQARERLSHSHHKRILQVSTAGYPNCFAGKTQVVVKEIASGLIFPKPIAELVGHHQKYQVLSYNRRGGNRPRWRAIRDAICRGVKPMCEVGLWGGHKIKCTGDHPFATEGNVPRGVGIDWTPILDVPRTPKRFGGKEGPKDGVLALTEFPDYENARWEDKIIEAPFDDITLGVVGAFVTEGTLSISGEVQIWQAPQGKSIRRAVRNWASLNGLTHRENDNGVFVQAGKRPDLVNLFQQCGSCSENKMIPKDILGGSARQLAVLLDYIIEGDGHRRTRSSTHDSNREWDIYTSSQVLASQLRFVGLRTGQPMSISTREQREGANHPQYCLSHNPESFRMDEILPKLGKIAVGEIKDCTRHGVNPELAYDLEVDGDPWFVLAESGCLVHNSDIHKQFLRGTQNFWHSNCNCPDGVILSEVFPECMEVHSDTEVYYRCPRCKIRIDDPQNGRFIPHNPGAKVQSYHIHQMLSKYIDAAEIWDRYQSTDNIKEFFNAKLGKPYVDEENIPVTDDDLESCVNTDISWQEKDTHCAMGVDQMGGNNYVYIAKRMPNNKKRLVHVEIIDNKNPIYWENGKPITPFKRLYQLMKDYDVDLCIIDAMPNANEAMDFAREFPKRVFVAWYLEQSKEVAQWGDRPKYKMTVRKGGPRIKFKYSVMLSRFLSIEMAMNAIAGREVEWPHPRGLIQECKSLKTGRFEPLHIFETHGYIHFKSIVKQKTITNDDTGAFKMEWVNLGLDPHSVHAWNYCNLALERLKRVPLMTFA